MNFAIDRIHKQMQILAPTKNEWSFFISFYAQTRALKKIPYVIHIYFDTVPFLHLACLFKRHLFKLFSDDDQSYLQKGEQWRKHSEN